MKRRGFFKGLAGLAAATAVGATARGQAKASGRMVPPEPHASDDDVEYEPLRGTAAMGDAGLQMGAEERIRIRRRRR